MLFEVIPDELKVLVEEVVLKEVGEKFVSELEGDKMFEGEFRFNLKFWNETFCFAYWLEVGEMGELIIGQFHKEMRLELKLKLFWLLLI